MPPVPPVLIAPPPIPQPTIFTGRYLLETDRVRFCKPECWATNEANRSLFLLAMADAPYNTPEERLANPDPARLEAAIEYLFTEMKADGSTQLRQDGIRRYRPKPGQTYCNIFVNDVTRILYCEIPNNPMPTNVKNMRLWLDNEGAAAGWRELPSGEEAQQWANDGHVAIMLQNGTRAKKSDHIALVRPGVGQLDDNNQRWPEVAQAGSIVGMDVQSRAVFTDTANIHFYGHD